MNRLYKATILLVCLVPVALAACEPDCSGANPGDLVEDPLSCSSYYICMVNGESTDQPVPCPTGEVFKPWKKCGKQGIIPCKPKCTVPDCHMTCSAATNDLIRNPLDCSESYVCSSGEVIASVTCEEPTPYFDGSTCVDDPAVCCSNLCVPYCYPDVVQAPDPLDCTRYYICLKEGLADEANHYPCPPNTYFDIPMGHCREGVPCVTLCSADGGSATTGISASTTPATSTEQGTTDSTTTNAGTTNTPTTTSTRGTTTQSTPSTTTTADPNGCVEQFPCPGEGSFPRCASMCDEGYFECGAAGELGVLQTCLQGFLFNTNPDLPYCVVADACPFYT